MTTTRRMTMMTTNPLPRSSMVCGVVTDALWVPVGPQDGFILIRVSWWTPWITYHSLIAYLVWSHLKWTRLLFSIFYQRFKSRQTVFYFQTHLNEWYRFLFPRIFCLHLQHQKCSVATILPYYVGFKFSFYKAINCVQPHEWKIPCASIERTHCHINPIDFLFSNAIPMAFWNMLFFPCNTAFCFVYIPNFPPWVFPLQHGYAHTACFEFLFTENRIIIIIISYFIPNQVLFDAFFLKSADPIIQQFRFWINWNFVARFTVLLWFAFFYIKFSLPILPKLRPLQNLVFSSVKLFLSIHLFIYLFIYLSFSANWL